MNNAYLNEQGAHTLMDYLRKRFPQNSDMLIVLGVSIFVCGSWAVLSFFDKFPSYTFYLRPTEIAVVFAYMMALAFLESLLITSVLAFVSMLLPRTWLWDGFDYKGFIIVVVGTIEAIHFGNVLKTGYPSVESLALDLTVSSVAIFTLILLSNRVAPLRKVLVDVESRFLIMLYLYGPIGIVSLAVVIVRNLL